MDYLNNIKFIGKGLKRPECVLIDPDNTLHVSDFRGGISRIKANGEINLIKPNNGFKIKPNGLTIVDKNSWLVTHLDETEGGVYKLSFDGEIEPFLLKIENKLMPPTNYVHFDYNGRIWITVSTTKIPRILSHNADCNDGFIILVEEGKSKIVADGLCFANECFYNPFDKKLYVNETFGKKISSFEIGKNGKLINKKTLTSFNFGEFPDGLTLDCEGCFWVTSIFSNKVIRVLPNGEKQNILEDNDPAHLNSIEVAYKKGILTRSLMNVNKSKKLKNISSLAFGGKNLKDIYLGCLLGDEIGYFTYNIAGLKPAFWKNIYLN